MAPRTGIALRDEATELNLDGGRRLTRYCEAIVLPRRWEDYADGRDKRFRMLRSSEDSPKEIGEALREFVLGTRR